MRGRLFTLVELMIVVAILGILAAIAIPVWSEYQLRARKAEAFVNVPALADVVRVAIAEGELTAYGSSSSVPRGDIDDLDKAAVPWPPSLDASWSGVTWGPDGAVRCAYSFANDPTVAGGGYFYAYAGCDLDDDDVVWRAGAGAVGAEPQGLWAGCWPFAGCPPTIVGTMDAGACCV